MNDGVQMGAKMLNRIGVVWGVFSVLVYVAEAQDLPPVLADLVWEWNQSCDVRDMIPWAGGEDSIAGILRAVPAGSYTQGSPNNEYCREESETQFSHTLSRSLMVMETEVTRQMWADLRAVQPGLPPDPSLPQYSPELDYPVQGCSWYVVLVFANLLSIQQGLTPCYYTNETGSTLVDVTNYDDFDGDVNTDPDFYCDFDAGGYRMPTEGEWEYFARAGTDGPFYVDEPTYDDTTCMASAPWNLEFPTLESVAWFISNRDAFGDDIRPKPVKMLTVNPWGFYDIHGNVNELCWDWSGDYPLTQCTDFQGASVRSRRIRRGGC